LKPRAGLSAARRPPCTTMSTTIVLKHCHHDAEPTEVTASVVASWSRSERRGADWYRAVKMGRVVETAHKWAARYAVEGPVGLVDRSSRPHRQPTRTPRTGVRQIVHLRWRQRLGPVQIGDRPPICRPRRSTRSWSRAQSTAWPAWTAPPGNGSGAANMSNRATCCTWMSKARQRPQRRRLASRGSASGKHDSDPHVTTLPAGKRPSRSSA
jgi:hypothetical protein